MTGHVRTALRSSFIQLCLCVETPVACSSNSLNSNTRVFSTALGGFSVYRNSCNVVLMAVLSPYPQYVLLYIVNSFYGRWKLRLGVPKGAVMSRGSAMRGSVASLATLAKRQTCCEPLASEILGDSLCDVPDPLLGVQSILGRPCSWDQQTLSASGKSLYNARGFPDLG